MDRGPRQTELLISDASALAARVVVSPLLTLAAALLDAFGDRPATPWRSLLRDRAAGLEPGPLAMFARSSFMIPNDLLPIPAGPSPSIADELAAMRRGSYERLLFDLYDAWGPGVPPELAPFERDPSAAVATYCNALAAHWDKLLAPSWPRLRRLLDRELLLLGHSLATAGVTTTLRGLHPAIAYESGRMRMEAMMMSPAFYDAKALTLAPMACEPERILINEDHPNTTVIAFAVRGAADLWDERMREPEPELASLLGPTRARIALALELPSTTSGLADALRLAPSTVSRHLSALASTGLVDSTRRGAFVVYRLTPRGCALLDLF